MKPLLTIFLLTLFLPMSAWSAFTISSKSSCDSETYPYRFVGSHEKADLVFDFGELQSNRIDSTFLVTDIPSKADIAFDDSLQSPDMLVCKGSSYSFLNLGKKVITIKQKTFEHKTHSVSIIYSTSFDTQPDYTIFHNSDNFTLKEAIMLVISTWKTDLSK